MRSYSDLPVCETYIVKEQSVNDVLRFTVIISFGFVFLSVRSNTSVLSYIYCTFFHIAQFYFVTRKTWYCGI